MKKSDFLLKTANLWFFTTDEYNWFFMNNNYPIRLIKEEKTVSTAVSIFVEKLYRGRLPISFGKVDKSFSCDGLGLSSLFGVPKSVGEGFFCKNNSLTSGMFCPEHVGKLAQLEGNNITIDGNWDKYLRILYK